MALLCTLALCMAISGYSEADKVNHNISKQADYFECERRITVYNARTDNIVLYCEGYMSISNDYENNELIVTVKTGPATYKKTTSISTTTRCMLWRTLPERIPIHITIRYIFTRKASSASTLGRDGIKQPPRSCGRGGCSFLLLLFLFPVLVNFLNMGRWTFGVCLAIFYKSRRKMPKHRFPCCADRFDNAIN